MHFALVAPKQLATDTAVRDALQSTFEGSQQRVAALVAALQDPGQRVAVRRACPPTHAKLLAAAEGLVQQHLASISAQQVSQQTLVCLSSCLLPHQVAVAPCCSVAFHVKQRGISLPMRTSQPSSSLRQC